MIKDILVVIKKLVLQIVKKLSYLLSLIIMQDCKICYTV